MPNTVFIGRVIHAQAITEQPRCATTSVKHEPDTVTEDTLSVVGDNDMEKTNMTLKAS